MVVNSANINQNDHLSSEISGHKMVVNSANINQNYHLSSEISGHKKDHDIWRWKSWSWLETGIQLWRVLTTYFDIERQYIVNKNLHRFISKPQKNNSSSGAPEFIPGFSGVTRSLVLCVCFVYRCLSFSFGNCVICSSIYVFWWPLWYLQTLFSFYGKACISLMSSQVDYLSSVILQLHLYC